jgi:hypothetical protein
MPPKQGENSGEYAAKPDAAATSVIVACGADHDLDSGFRQNDDFGVDARARHSKLLNAPSRIQHRATVCTNRFNA